MRTINALVLIILLVFVNLGDTLFTGSMGRLSRQTRDTLNKLALEWTLPLKKREKVSKIPKEPKKSLTDQFFDRALEEAEKQTNATYEPEEKLEKKRR